MKTRLFSFLFLSCLAVALVAVFFGRNRRVSTATVPEAELAAAVPAEAPPPQPTAPRTPVSSYSTYHWRRGDRACWQFGVSLRMAGAPEKIAESGETRVGGRLQLVVLNADDQRVTVAAAVSDAWLDTDGRRIRRYEEFFNATPAILTLSPAGHLIELALPRHVAAEDRNMIRLAYGWEFVARNAPSYEEAEHAPDDAGGVFRASYRRADANRIRKSRFFQPSSAEQLDAMQTVTASEFTSTVGNVWVREMAGWEDTSMSLNGSIFAVSRVVMSFKEETNSPALTPALSTLLATPGSAVAFSKIPDPIASSQSESVTQAVRREALASRWGTAPFEQVLHPIQALANGTLQELAKPLKDFEDWLTVHPDDGPWTVLRSLQGLPADQTSLSGLLIHGLAETEAGTARKALAVVLEGPDFFPPTTVIQAAVAVGDFGAGSDQALKETLVRLMDSPVSDGSYRLSDTALFSFARIAKDDAASQEYLVQRVGPWLEAGAAPEDTVKALSALANAAVDQPRLVERAARFAQSADADIRLAAVDYLESVPSSSSGRAVMDPLLADPDGRGPAEAERLRTQPRSRP